MKIKRTIFLSLVFLTLLTQSTPAAETGFWSTITRPFTALLKNSKVQQVTVGLGLVATPYVYTWLLMNRAHARFDDAIALIKPPVNINTINVAVHTIDNDIKEIFTKIKEALPNNKINPAFKEHVVEVFMPWWNAIAELNDKIINNTKILSEELKKNESNNKNIKILTERTKNIEESNNDFTNTINAMKVTSTKPYSDEITAFTNIILLSSNNRTRQSALITLINQVIPALEKEFKEKDPTDKLLTLIRGKYNISTETETATALIKYRDDLTHYINRLWYLRFFYLGTGKYAEIQKLITELETIRAIVASTKELKKEIEP